MLNYCFNGLWVSLPTPARAKSHAWKHTTRNQKLTVKVKCFFHLCDCRSTSHATPCRVLTWRRPHPGLRGRLSTSQTTAGTTNSASATLARLASQTPACWKWEGRGSRCATAPVTALPAAPLMVSGECRKQMVSIQLFQLLGVLLLSLSNWLAASLQAGYWPPHSKPSFLSVRLLFIRSFPAFFLALSHFQTLPLSVLQKLTECCLNQLLCLQSHDSRLYQQIKASVMLMNFLSTKPISSLQLILGLPCNLSHSHAHKHKSANTHTDACTQFNYSLTETHKQKLFIHHLSYSLLPELVHHAVSVSHTPGELNAVNVCTNRLLIDKLFMLSSGRIHIRGQAGWHHTTAKRLQIQMQQLKFVYGIAHSLRGKSRLFKALELAPG